MERMLINITREEYYPIDENTEPLVLSSREDSSLSAVLEKLATWDTRQDYIVLATEEDSLRFSETLPDEDEKTSASNFFKTAYLSGFSDLASALRFKGDYPNIYQFAIVMFDEVYTLAANLVTEHDGDAAMPTQSGGLRSAKWIVGSFSNVEKVYHVRLLEQRSNRMTCTCPSFIHRQEYCKHIVSVLRRGSMARHDALEVKIYTD